MELLVFAVLTVGMLAAAAVPVRAQQTPCVACAISRAQSAAAVRANQAIVQSTLQNALNAQLQTQANALQTQQLLRSAQLSGAVGAGSAELQQLLIEQQLELLQLEQHAAKPAPLRPKKPPVPKKGP